MNKYLLTILNEDIIETLLVSANFFEINNSGTLQFYHFVNEKKLLISAYSQNKWQDCHLLNNLDKPLLTEPNSSYNNNSYGNQNSSNSTTQSNVDKSSSVNKKSILEQYVKHYFLNIKSFNFDNLKFNLNNYLQQKNIFEKYSSEEIEELIISLIKKKSIPMNKFLDNNKNNLFNVYVKSILNRHWKDDESISLIYQMINNQNETSELSIFDFVAWLSLNKYI